MVPAPTEPRTTARTLSLRAPIRGEEERAHFQRRLALTFLVAFGLSFGFWGATALVVAVAARDHFVSLLVDPANLTHLGASLVAGATWLAVRSGHRSVRTLESVDAAGSIAVCFGWIAMIAWPRGVPLPRIELVAFLACTYTLVMRAALLPSTPARSALISVVATLPLVPLSPLGYVGAPEAALGPQMPHEIFAGLWIALGAGAAAIISWVIYGLRLEVRKAKQLGQYTLEEKIGEGGMGAVYRAHHAMLRRPTAIKLLTRTTGAALERFEREVQMTSKLTHPNTIAVYDYGRTPDGVFYYAMEYLDGVSLEDLVARFGPLPVPRAVHVLQQVCAALEEAHAVGLVHRDVKPANIMLTERGTIPDFVKVLDFGLVKEQASKSPALSTANTIIGTPHYMAPEAIVSPSTVDGRADLYGVGAVAYFMLVGRPLFEGNVVEVCSKHLHEAPPRPTEKRSEIPGGLEALVLECLAKKPEERPRDARAILRRLEALEIAPWTREDAARWWEDNGEAARRRRARADGKTGAYGDTVSVALDEGRALGA